MSNIVMPRPDLLPGVSRATGASPITGRSVGIIVDARRRANLRDAAQLGLLITVDWLFLRWPAAHIPSFTRDSSLDLVLLMNAVAVLHVIVARMWPVWRARRVASTWSARERAHLTQTVRSSRTRLMTKR